MDKSQKIVSDNQAHALRDNSDVSNEDEYSFSPSGDIAEIAIGDASPPKPSEVLQLQRVLGNRAVTNIIGHHTQKVSPTSNTSSLFGGLITAQPKSIQRAAEGELSGGEAQAPLAEGEAGPEVQIPPNALATGDKLQFNRVFGVAIAQPRSVEVTGSGPVNNAGNKIALEGDEKSWSVEGIAYTAGGFAIPGMGKIEIVDLGPEHFTEANLGKQVVVHNGGSISVKLVVQSPAMDPATGTPDPSPEYAGIGQFVSNGPRGEVGERG